MGTILQFAERLAEAGDWTPAERSQLRDMGAQLGEAAAGLDLVFGKTEEGDPWCVVADERSEVLLHVARIGGGFVVHAPRNDQVIESHDLWLAVSRVLGGVLRDRRGLILPFPPEAMGQPAILALMLAAAVRGDFAGTIQTLLPAAPTPDDRPEATPMPAAPDHLQAAATEARHAAPAQAVHTAEALPAHAATPAQVPAAAPEAARAEGGPLDARAPVQTAVAPEAAPIPRTAPDPGHVPAPASAQTAGFAPPRAPATPDADSAMAGASVSDAGGGAGDAAPASTVRTAHTVAVTSGAVAQGQSGEADDFVLTAPVKVEGANVISLGVVSGFSVGEGDRLVFANGATPAVVEVTELHPLSTSAAGVVGESGRRIGYDLDGDGREDAYVVVLDAPAALTLHKAADIAIEPAATLVGAPPTTSIVVVFIGQ